MWTQKVKTFSDCYLQKKINLIIYQNEVKKWLEDVIYVEKV